MPGHYDAKAGCRQFGAGFDARARRKRPPGARGGNRIGQERRDEISALRRRGATLTAIACATHVSVTTIQRVLRESGMPMDTRRGRRLTADDLARAAAMAAAGIGTRQIAAELPCSVSTVNRRLRRGRM
ncbi:MAG: helix-turn-helix domain-containing protein [Alphaproteobacteria bacterium]|nr:helix-turn-helix domain-containing protein [Alphaproteobacteria bacterium]